MGYPLARLVQRLFVLQVAKKGNEFDTSMKSEDAENEDDDDDGVCGCIILFLKHYCLV